MRTNFPVPRRTASASMSAVHGCPRTANVARAQSQRLKACAIAPVTPLRACAFAAIAGKDNGGSPCITSWPSCHRALLHSPALRLFGAMPHSSSAAGQRPKRKMTRAASAAACVPTWAPDRGRGCRTDGRHPTRIARCRVLRLLIDREGVAGAHEIERAECVDPEDGNFVRDAAQIGCHAISDCRPNAVAHLGAVAIDGNLAIAPRFRRNRAQHRLRCRNSWLHTRRRYRRGFPAAVRAPSPRHARAQIGCFSSLSRISGRAD